MSLVPQSRSRRSGFSLVEALVALTVAGLLTAALTRLIVATRANAARVGELTEMTALGETLMARVTSSTGLRPGRTDGRRGAYTWHIDVAPISFTAVARTRSEKKPPDQNRAEPSGTPARAPAFPRVGTSQAPSSPATRWAAYRVAVVVEAPSGRTYAVNTIRIGPQPGPHDR